MSVCVKQDGQLVKSAGLYSVTKPIGMADIYSTEEKEVGLWIDNKPLYQKSIMLDDVTIPQSGRVLIGLGTYISNIDNVIGGEVIVIDGNSNIVLPSFQIATMSQYGLTYTINKADGIVISRGSDSGAVTRDFIATVRYTKTNDTPWSGKFVPQGYGYVSSGDIYSLEERQVGVWIDAKPLYQKTVNLGTLTASSNKTVAYSDVGISDIETVVYFDVILNNQFNSNFNRPDNANAEFYTQLIPTGIFIRTYNNAVTSAYATFQYTKTTDVAGSGEYVPSGDKAEHYTADEHIIGTWTDGSTLYERTVRVPANTTGQNIVTLWNDTNIQVREYNGCFVFRASENTASLCCRPTDNSYKLVVYTIGCSEQYGVYAEIDLGTQRGNAVDLMLTLKYIKVTS